MGRNNLTGAWGEELAAAYLRKKRYTLLAAGYRSRFGEIDLIAKTSQFIVFVEVKLRKNSNYAQAFEHVDRRKQDRIRMTASIYLSQHDTTLQPRFDVVEVVTDTATGMKAVEINHIMGAYETGDLGGAF